MASGLAASKVCSRAWRLQQGCHRGVAVGRVARRPTDRSPSACPPKGLCLPTLSVSGARLNLPWPVSVKQALSVPCREGNGEPL